MLESQHEGTNDPSIMVQVRDEERMISVHRLGLVHCVSFDGLTWVTGTEYSL